MQNIFSSLQSEVQGTQAGIHNPDRPFGVTLIASAIGFVGGLYLFWMVLTLCALNFLSYFIPSGTSGASLLTPLVYFAPDAALSILSILSISALGFGHLALARGLFRLKPWAYWATLCVEGFSVLVSFVILSATHNGFQFFTTIYIPALVIGYLLALSGVRKAFHVPF